MMMHTVSRPIVTGPRARPGKRSDEHIRTERHCERARRIAGGPS